MSIQNYAKLIFTDESIIVDKTKELDDRLISISKNIFENSIQRQGRSFNQVYEAQKKTVIEDALVKLEVGFIHNPLEWNYKVPHSHSYDIVHSDHCKTFEIKRWPQDQPNGNLAKWFSYPRNAFKNFIKHNDIIDYIISGKMIEHEHSYEIGFHMIADAKTFMNYVKESIYKKDQLVYYHSNAINDGMCIMNYNVKYRR